MTTQSPRPTVSLVINGDDFGYSTTINEAIIRCHTSGILTSTTLLVNQPATRAALALARQYPTLGVGWHLNLTTGYPVLPPAAVPTLVDRRGHFRPMMSQFWNLLTGTVRQHELISELRAQLAILLDAGIQPTHVDGHLHMHALPTVLPIVLDLLAEQRIQALRSPIVSAWLTSQPGQRFENPWSSPQLKFPHSLINAGTPLLRVLARLAPPFERPQLGQLARAKVQVATRLFDAAHFINRATPGPDLARAIVSSGATLVEVMAHPAWNRDARRGDAEIALLTDPHVRAALDEQGIQRVYYGQ